MTFYICFGKYAGFSLKFDLGIRLTLGWIGISIIFLDIEVALGKLTDIIDEKEKQLAMVQNIKKDC